MVIYFIYPTPHASKEPGRKRKWKFFLFHVILYGAGDKQTQEQKNSCCFTVHWFLLNTEMLQSSN